MALGIKGKRSLTRRSVGIRLGNSAEEYLGDNLVDNEAPFLWGNAATCEHVMATCVCGFPFCRGV